MPEKRSQPRPAADANLSRAKTSVRNLNLGACLWLLLTSGPALAQRANESAASAAEDAFGTSVGNERVGLYNPDSTRGFSPVTAGNLRLDGLYIDRPPDFSQRLITGSNIRVGLTAQGFPFAAPTGVADYSLRRAGRDRSLTATLEAGPYSAGRLAVDAQSPLTGTLSLGGGFDYAREDQANGTTDYYYTFAIVPVWRPRDGVEIVPFYSQYYWKGWSGQPLYFPSGDFLPPKISRHDSPKQDWAGEAGIAPTYGIHSRAKLGPWLLQAGLFRSFFRIEGSTSELFLNVDSSGTGDRQIIALGHRRTSSISGEVRVSRQFDEGSRRHTFLVNLRGRDRQRQYGGGVTFALGRTPIDDQISIPRPDFNLGSPSHDHIRQLNVGAGYDLRWLGVGQLSLGVQRLSYSKQAERPGVQLPTSRSKPWLVNAALNFEPVKSLAVYGSYSTGLEESPIAPAVASNNGFAPPAILTKQYDAGLRYIISPNLRLVAGVYQIEKPYYGLDANQLFTNLGSIRNRGVELSLTGTIAPGLTVVAGTVLMDANLSGKAVEQKLVGQRPVGSSRRTSFANVEYQLKGIEGVTAVLGYAGRGRTIANRMNTLTIDPANSFSVGARYRFNVGGKPTSLYARVANITDEYSYQVSGEGLYYSTGRRFIATLTSDF